MKIQNWGAAGEGGKIEVLVLGDKVR